MDGGKIIKFCNVYRKLTVIRLTFDVQIKFFLTFKQFGVPPNPYMH